jgi:hypothetical protein
MLRVRAAKHNLCITAGDETSAFFVPAERRSAAACPGLVHFPSRKAARR